MEEVFLEKVRKVPMVPELEGAPDAESLQAKRSAGELSAAHLEAAAHLGYPPAREALGLEPRSDDLDADEEYNVSPYVLEWFNTIVTFGVDVGARAALTYAEVRLDLEDEEPQVKSLEAPCLAYLRDPSPSNTQALDAWFGRHEELYSSTAKDLGHFVEAQFEHMFDEGWEESEIVIATLGEDFVEASEGAEEEMEYEFLACHVPYRNLRRCVAENLLPYVLGLGDPLAALPERVPED